MINPAVPKSFTDEMRRIDKGLFLVWNRELERYHVFHKDGRNGVTRIIFTIEDDDGNLIPCDNRALDFLRDAVHWDLIGKFPQPSELMSYLRDSRKKKDLSALTAREEYRKAWNKAHRKHWRAAMENFGRGILTLPEKTKSKIISTQGVSPGNSEIIVPVGLHD